MFARYSKAFGALLGGLTPAIVVAILAVFGVHVDGTLAAGICTVCGVIATAWAPANTPKPPVLLPPQ